MSRDMSNVAVMRALPCDDVDTIVCTPSTCAIASSIGLTMPVSTSSGAAPVQVIETEIVG